MAYNNPENELEKKDRKDIKALAACLGVAIAGISWMLWGPIGLFLGATCGMAAALRFIKSADEAISKEKKAGGQSTRRRATNSFQLSLLVLASAVMRADGHITRGELDEFKNFWKTNFGEQQTLEALQLLKEMVQHDSDYPTICRQIAGHMTYSARLELLHFLLRIAAADNIVNSEVNIIASMATYLGIGRSDYLSLLQVYLHRNHTDGTGSQSRQEYRSNSGYAASSQLGWAYQLLQIDESASDEEIKKAYRRMAMKYHPDKVASLGESVRQSATEKFKKVGEAYEQIKRARGMN